MTYVNWQNGNILTAGSLRLIPQFYNGGTDAINSANGLIVSGGVFSESLLVSATLCLPKGASEIVGSVVITTSGAGLAGGSTVYATAAGTLSIQHGSGSAALTAFVKIGSNSGWIPGSAVFVSVGGTAGASCTGFMLYGTG